ncbi:hypothetical protein GCM10011505_37110 [Tistrella bauzanensis]|uniref:Class I SAM-dependent methyltransferase n=1 Tax=Tistrella bauzanensis TaxID=657419 RepID=A0ABQ1IW45_9PROT|nr:SAM-dependent methyltransferase [Tistrella bauzanensis]GGB52669.1 hypothetical protein GCM10011505_37110 [Tistrella bauzanensis]
MSDETGRGGFDAGWLDLRAGFDHAARVPALERRLAAMLRRRPGNQLTIVDLGAGTGGGLLHLAPCLTRWLSPGIHQSWRLVERDPALIAAGQTRLATLPAVVAGDLRVTYQPADLALEDLSGLIADADLVHFTALIDLAGMDWLVRLADAVAARGVPMLGALTFDGRMDWSPPADGDDAAVAGFIHHQRRDKGLGGVALGADAAPALARLLTDRGMAVRLVASDWVIGPEDTAMHAAMVDGVAGALEDLAADGLVPAGQPAAFRSARDAASPGRLVVGHLDLLAWRRGRE